MSQCFMRMRMHVLPCLQAVLPAVLVCEADASKEVRTWHACMRGRVDGGEGVGKPRCVDASKGVGESAYLCLGVRTCRRVLLSAADGRPAFVSPTAHNHEHKRPHA
eukprot:1137726-Pelagomonas_calceolata.AAC.4